jgi:hypothetical protein
MIEVAHLAQIGSCIAGSVMAYCLADDRREAAQQFVLDLISPASERRRYDIHGVSRLSRMRSKAIL